MWAKKVEKDDVKTLEIIKSMSLMYFGAQQIETEPYLYVDRFARELENDNWELITFSS